MDNTSKIIAVKKKKKKAGALSEANQKVLNRAQKEIQKIVRETASNLSAQLGSILTSVISTSLALGSSSATAAASTAATVVAAAAAVASQVAAVTAVATATGVTAIAVDAVELEELLNEDIVSEMLDVAGVELSPEQIKALTEALNELSPKEKKEILDLQKDGELSEEEILATTINILSNTSTQTQQALEQVISIDFIQSEAESRLREIDDREVELEDGGIVSIGNLITRGPFFENQQITLEVEVFDSSVGGTVIQQVTLSAQDFERSDTAEVVVFYRSPGSNIDVVRTFNINIQDVNEVASVDFDVSPIQENTTNSIDIEILDPEDGSLVRTINVEPQDFESNTSVDIPFSFTDSGGLTVDTTITIPILDVNEHAVFESVNVSSVNENELTNIVVTWRDPEDGLIISNHLIPVQDFEQMTSINLNVDIIDSGGLQSTHELEFDVLDVNEAPTSITSNLTISPQGNFVVSLFAADPDTLETISFFADGVALPNNQLVFTPEFLGSDPEDVVLTAVDSGGLSISLTVSPPEIVDTPGNDAPQLAFQNITSIPENMSATIEVTFYDPEDGLITTTLNVEPQDFETNESVTLPVEILDSEGLVGNGNIQLQITDVNERADFVSADITSVDENTIGTVVVTWFDPEDGFFTSSHDIPVQDFENNSTVTIQVSSIDSGGLATNASDLTLDVNNVNEEATLVGVNNSRILENLNREGEIIDSEVTNTVIATFDDPEDGIVEVEIELDPQDFENGSSVDIDLEYLDSGGLLSIGTENFEVLDSVFDNNRIINGDFENGNVGWEGFISDFSVNVDHDNDGNISRGIYVPAVPTFNDFVFNPSFGDFFFPPPPVNQGVDALALQAVPQPIENVTYTLSYTLTATTAGLNPIRVDHFSHSEVYQLELGETISVVDDSVVNTTRFQFGFFSVSTANPVFFEGFGYVIDDIVLLENLPPDLSTEFVVNGSFDDGLSGWIEGPENSIDLRDSASFSNDGSFIDFDNGDVSDSGSSISQTIQGLVPGREYVLRFDYLTVEESPTPLTVKFNGETLIGLDGFQRNTNSEYVTLEYVISVPNDFNFNINEDVLEFSTTTSANLSPAIDNISIVQAPPEITGVAEISLASSPELLELSQVNSVIDLSLGNIYDTANLTGLGVDSVVSNNAEETTQIFISNGTSPDVGSQLHNAVALKFTAGDDITSLDLAADINIQQVSPENLEFSIYALNDNFDLIGNPLDTVTLEDVGPIGDTTRREISFDIDLEADNYAVVIDIDGTDNNTITDWTLDDLELSATFDQSLV